MKRDIFLPSLTTLLIFGMTVFLSCAHQDRVKDGLDANNGDETEQSTVTEEGSAAPDQKQGELADLNQDPAMGLPADGAAASTDQPPAADGTQTQADATQAAGTPAQKSAEDADLTSLGMDPNSAAATPDGAAATAETKAVENGAPAEANAQANAGTDPVLGLESGATAGAAATSDTTTAQETPPPADSSAVVPPPTTTETVATNDTQITKMDPIISPEGGTKHKHHSAAAAGFSGTSRVPKIPSNAVTRGGAKLNRFYFVRQGDTPETVSQLIYGSPAKAESLAKWNGKHWEAGKLVFYQSPNDASESKMRSFYQEKGVQPDEYTIQRGDWLSKISAKKLGSAKSWKEIAVINGMNSPDSIEVGQKIAVYPRDFSGFSGQNVAQQEKVQEPEPQKIEQPAQPQQPVAQNVPNNPQAQAQPPTQDNVDLQNNQTPPPTPQEPKKAPKQGVDPSKMVEQNLPAVFILGGVLVLSLLYLSVRRKKSKGSSDEFSDENFAPPTKLKRK